MFKNQYDTDATTFAPNGRLFQVEYAEEAIKQGSAVVAVRSKDFAVIVALKRAASTLASYQPKIFKIDDHLGIGVSGLIADARHLCRHMQTECLNHKYVFDAPLQVGRLVGQISDMAQVFTQKAEKRPYGVGLLVIGYDKTGPHVYQTMPSGTYEEYIAQAMGARAQGAKTYLEKTFETYAECKLDDLIEHALTALKAASPKPLTTKSVSIAYVGKDTPYTQLEEDATRPYVAKVEAGDVDLDEEKRESRNVERTLAPPSPRSAARAVGTEASASSSSSGSTDEIARRPMEE